MEFEITLSQRDLLLGEAGFDLAYEDDSKYYVSSGFIQKLESNGTDVEAIFQAALGQSIADTLDGYGKSMRIYEVCDHTISQKHFHEINYKSELTQSLFPVFTFEKGLLILTEWFKNEDLTEKVLEVSAVYEKDVFNLITRRTVTRTWFYDDDTPNSDIKVSIKNYEHNIVIRDKAAIRTRDNIVSELKMYVLGMMLNTMPVYGQETDPLLIEAQGVEFFAERISMFDTYIAVGYEEILENITSSTEAWLDNVIDADTGATIRDYVLGALS